jgi:hypothetical protein
MNTAPHNPDDRPSAPRPGQSKEPTAHDARRRVWIKDGYLQGFLISQAIGWSLVIYSFAEMGGGLVPLGAAIIAASWLAYHDDTPPSSGPRR